MSKRRTQASDRRDELVEIRNAPCRNCGTVATTALRAPSGVPSSDGVVDQLVKLTDPELQRAVDALREVGAVNAAVQLSDGRVLVYRGGPFGSVEIMHGDVSIVINGLQARGVQ